MQSNLHVVIILDGVKNINALPLITAVKRMELSQHEGLGRMQRHSSSSNLPVVLVDEE